jgi:hypothetical protein
MEEVEDAELVVDRIVALDLGKPSTQQILGPSCPNSSSAEGDFCHSEAGAESSSSRPHRLRGRLGGVQGRSPICMRTRTSIVVTSSCRSSL